MNETKLAGVYPILATPFDDEGRVDRDSQLRLIDWLLEEGAHGFGLFGNAGEGYTLTEAERRDLMHLISKRVNGRGPLVVSAGHTGTDVAAESSRQAEAEGAAALMVLPPYYMKTDADGLVRYYEAIGKAVQIPVMVQDAPLMTQVAMPAALLARLSRELENIRYAKVEAPPTAPKITEVLRLSDGRLTAFGGLNGQFLIEELERGAMGTMPGSDMTSIYVRIWECFHAGEKDEAWRLFVHALPLIRFELQPGLGVSAMKHNLVAAGVIRSVEVRHPTGSLTPESIRELEFLRSWVAQVALHAART